VAANNELRRDFKDRDELRQHLMEQFPDASDVDSCLSPIRGGRSAAQNRLNQFDAIQYEGSRNFLDGEVSGLSPYIRHGVLTLAEVRESIAGKFGLNRLSKFVQELAWRDYWQRLYFQLGDGIWQDREENKTGIDASCYSAVMPDDIAHGQTGLACIDAFRNDLTANGYLHNHARMWLAAYVVHWRRVRWQVGAHWFLQHLLDGDPASNNLSWQWVASTFSSKPYFFNRENLERYTKSKYCRECPRRNSCPFDASYDTLEAKLFHRTDGQQ
jgi:deoxyribodipyrimidine photo-lyase